MLKAWWSRKEDKTVETVSRIFIPPPITGLKPGVNEMLNCRTFEAKPVV